jgi:hypothetical protein
VCAGSTAARQRGNAASARARPHPGRALVGVGKPASLEFGPLVRIDSGEATRFSAAPALIGQNGQAKAVAQPGLPLT